MDEITFEWDTKKAQTNDSPRRGYRQRKHGISFEEAETHSTIQMLGLLTIQTTHKMKTAISYWG
jgi:uncharacterized DUF497 family protein